MSVEHLLLDGYLKQLRLSTFIKNYQPFAEDATKTNQGYERFLLALAEQEVAQRDLNSQRQRLKAAKFPLLKELGE